MKLAMLSLLACLAFPAWAQEPTAGNSSPSPLDQKLIAYFQTVLSQNKQQVFLKFHPFGGKATAITVTGSKITQWSGGTDTEDPKDIVQFTVDFTILWSSFLHPHDTGHTEARNTYIVQNSQVQVVGRQIIATNGKYNIDNASKDVMEAAKFFVLLK